MPLELLLVLVIGGIAGIAVLLHVMGFSRGLVFENEAAAEAAWLRAFPDDSVQNVSLSESRTAALIDSVQGGGLVSAFGADSVAHRKDTSPRALRHVALTETERHLWLQQLESTS